MYLYHQVPRQFFGWDIVPLNQIKRFDHGLYTQYLQKYKGREHVLKTIIPLLQCGWSDVLFLTAVSPDEWKRVFHTIDHAIDTLSFYQIPLGKINIHSAVVMEYNESNHERFSWFYPRNLKKIGKIPEKTCAYYKEAHDKGEPVFLHHLVPQILYRGTLNISGCPIITV